MSSLNPESIPVPIRYFNAMEIRGRHHFLQAAISHTISPLLFPIPSGCQPASPTVEFYKFSSHCGHTDQGPGSRDPAGVNCLSGASESVTSHLMCVHSSCTQSLGTESVSLLLSNLPSALLCPTCLSDSREILCLEQPCTWYVWKSTCSP